MTPILNAGRVTGRTRKKRPRASMDAVAATPKSPARHYLLVLGIGVACMPNVVLAEDGQIANPTSSEQAREDAMFGGGAPQDDAWVEAAPASAPAVVPAGDDTETRLERMMSAQEDRLQVGGFMYLRLDYSVLEDADLNRSAISSPSLFDVYLDSRPNDRVRGYVRGRLRHDFTAPGDTLLLDQMWLKFDIERRLYLTVGKQAVRWGSGRFWNPTDFLNQQVRDPLAVFDERAGIALVKAHLPIESLGWNFYAVANLEGAARADQISGALRGEFVWGPAELSLSWAEKSGGLHQVGVDLSAGVWLLDVRFEAAAQKGGDRTFYKGPFDITRLQFPQLRDREDDWIVQAVGGVEIEVQYSDQDSLILAGEYFYNDAGYRNAALYPWLFLQGAAQPLYLGRHYAVASAVLMGPGSWNDTTLFATWLANLSDESHLTRLDYRVRTLTWLDVSAYGTYHFGDIGEFHYGLEIPAFPVEGLEQGFSLTPPRWEAGMALRANF